MLMKKNKLFQNNYHFLLFFFFYLTILVGFYFDEDNLGGAMHDATIHFEISKNFTENFSQTFKNFGTHESGLSTRNSPIFWIFLSFLSKYLSYDVIRILNTTVIFAIAVIFYKSLAIKFRDINHKYLIVLTTLIFFSPSLRSLAIWPYSLIWGLFFFLISIYYYLKFINNLNFIKSSVILFNVIIASYIYPSFSVFYLFYLSEFFIRYKKIHHIIGLLFFSFILSIPCLVYVFSKDFFSAFQSSQGVAELSFSQSLNISNKILIISTLCFYFLLPIINFKEIFDKIKKTNNKTIFFLFVFCLLNFYYFNFPYDVWGGGFFHKISNFLFNNNYLFFLSSIISIFIIFLVLEKKFNNYLLLVILILYNPQFTIYIKYFDPLILILFLTLFDFNLKKHFVEKTYNYYQFYGAILFYYIIIYVKKILI